MTSGVGTEVLGQIPPIHTRLGMLRWRKKTQGLETPPPMSSEYNEHGGACRAYASDGTCDNDYITLRKIQEPQPPPSITPLVCTGAMVEVNGIEFLGHHNLILAACSDGIVRVYDLNSTGVPRVMFAGHSSSVRGLVHIQDDVVASVGSDQNVLLWHAASGKRISTLKIEDVGLLTAVSKISASTLVVGTGWGHLLFVSFNLRDRNAKCNIIDRAEHAHEKEVKDIAVHSNLMVSCSWDKTAKAWDATSHQLLDVFVHNDRIISTDADNSFILTGCMDGSLYVRRNTPGFPLTFVFRTNDSWLRSVCIYNDDVVSFIGDSGYLSFVSLSSASRIACIKAPGSFMRCSVVVNDGRITVGGRAGFCGIISPPSQISESIDECVARHFPWSSIAITMHQYPPRLAWFGVQSGMISLLDACENSITAKNCALSVEEWIFAHHLLINAIEQGQIPASKDDEDRKSHWFHVLYKHTSKLPMGEHDVGFLASMFQQAETIGLLSTGRADEFIHNIETRTSTHDNVIPGHSYLVDALWRLLMNQAEESKRWKSILQCEEPKLIPNLFRSLTECMPFCNQLFTNQASFYMSPFFTKADSLNTFDPGILIITADVALLSIQERKQLLRRFTKCCKILLSSEEWDSIPNENRSSVTKALESLGLTITDLREKLLRVSKQVSPRAKTDARKKNEDEILNKNSQAQEKPQSEETSTSITVYGSKDTGDKSNEDAVNLEPALPLSKLPVDQETNQEANNEIQKESYEEKRHANRYLFEWKNALKEELKEELRSQVKKEVQDELQSEVIAEMRNQIKAEIVEETRANLMKDLRIAFREEFDENVKSLGLKLVQAVGSELMKANNGTTSVGARTL